MAATNGQSANANNNPVVRGICPAGWHVPTDEEWVTMENHVNNVPNDDMGSNSNNNTWRGTFAGKLATCALPWKSSSAATTVGNPGNYSYGSPNVSGFSALPAGGYYYSADSGTSVYKFKFSENAAFFSSTIVKINNNDRPCIRILKYNDTSVYRGAHNNYRKSSAFSVRCVRD